jgi:predicted N-acetyltransferase YhbS
VSESTEVFEIKYKVGNDLNLDAVIELYRDSTLRDRRPIEERTRLEAMIQNANLVVTAWDGDQIVGISRALSDFSFVTYLSDLAVRKSHQKKGVGKELIRRTQIAGGPQTLLVLLSAPAAEAFYPHVGFTHHPQAWILNPEKSSH